ncbi:DNA repair protein RecN [Bacteroidales bacterium]
MLRRLRISNYALIEHLEIEFKPGFTVITGETGAGKSILLGALGLVLGNRADTSVLHNKESKCQVEAIFDVKEAPVRDFFTANDLDYDDECIVLREIAPGGKSRAFVNDSPVNLPILKSLGELLVDIHSQHDSLHLTDSTFQIRIIDGLAGNEIQQRDYIQAFQKWQQLRQELEHLKNMAGDNQAEEEILRFQLDELVKANLQSGEMVELTQNLEILSHAEEIKLGLYAAGEVLNRSETNVISLLREAIGHLGKSARYFPELQALAERLESVLVELKDVARETELAELRVSFDPDELEKTQARIAYIRQLMMKHRVNEADELLRIRSQIEARLDRINTKEFNIEQLSRQLDQAEKRLGEKAQLLTQTRQRVIPEMERAMRLLLVQLGMPNASFTAKLGRADTFVSSGGDRLNFLFSANKGIAPDDISRVASGGELSRLMLAIKSLISGQKNVPTIIFDEIDTGVSGEIAARVGRIMATMARQTQLVAITHLPQIAGKASQHLLVYKKEDEKRTRSLIINLSQQQRVDEIARMLSDDVVTPAARNAAKELMSGY